MNKLLRHLLPVASILCGAALASVSHAQDFTSWTSDSDRNVVSVGHDIELGKGEQADTVVAVFGSATVDGDVRDSVVSILGDSHVTGNVGDTAVAVLGNAYIDSRIDGNVVAVLGDVRLGPNADVRGQVIEILGTVERSPTAVIEGGTVGVLTGFFGSTAGLHGWIREGLLYGRPLAPDLRLGWAWGVAFALLALYLLIALLFRDAVERCVQTLELHPGPSLLAAVLATLLIPAVVIALLITVIGIAVIPFFWLGVFCAGMFGRIVALSWLGGRFLRLGNLHAPAPMAISVLLGGIVALALYMVPVLGFIVYLLLGVFGFGAVIYTLVLSVKAARERAGPTRPLGAAAAGRVPPPAGGMPPGGAAASVGHGTSSPEAAASWSGAGAQAGDGAPPPHSPGEAPSASASAGGAGQDAPPGASHGSAWGAPPLDPQLALTYPRAGFWIRMGALFIDLVLVSFALSLIYHHGARGTLLIVAAYAAIMWKLRGSTVGGIVFDLHVTRLNGRPIDWETAIVRALACFLSLAALGLGFFWIAIDPERQAWHDKIAGTVVVRAAQGVALV
ncbi:MAG TPA: RDD family protein [Steroidobacteraceae bacterium]|nr:RDD family protein [Steroidobacteraceae bacterium]